VIGIGSGMIAGDKLDETIVYLLEQADQVVLVVPPDAASWEQIDKVCAQIKTAIRPEKTNQFIVGNRTRALQASIPLAGHADFDVPFLPDLPPLAGRTTKTLPHALLDAAAILADRLGRINQIGVYIPTTSDTSRYVTQTLAFLGNLFGETSNQPQGVWDNDQVGLVSDKIYVVKTSVTRSDMDHYLGQVLEFVEKLKLELNQEAMALEVNQKLMLI
jgi:hypothetical protein